LTSADAPHLLIPSVCIPLCQELLEAASILQPFYSASVHLWNIYNLAELSH
jgi:hypothetical protein